MKFFSSKGSKGGKRRQPSRAARQRVRDAFDPEMLTDLCVRQDFGDYAERIDLEPSVDKYGQRDRFYWYQDNGSDILAIAHLDSVQDDGTCIITDTTAGLLACSGALDDRLGVYVILDLLPALGVTCDWLLTTDEEIGQSTADEFVPNKKYKWMFQFDRGGTDVVMYQYETEYLAKLVEDCGAHVGQGSFSDICLLDHLGVAGFNWGVGYQEYHSARSHAWLDDTFRMVARFVKFYKANASVTMVDDSFESHERAVDWSKWGDDPDDYPDEYADPQFAVELTNEEEEEIAYQRALREISDPEDDTVALREWLEAHKTSNKGTDAVS